MIPTRDSSGEEILPAGTVQTLIKLLTDHKLDYLKVGQVEIKKSIWPGEAQPLPRKLTPAEQALEDEKDLFHSAGG